MTQPLVPFTELLSAIVDNRGRTCPTAQTGLALIATNCVKNDGLYPVKEKVRYVDDETYETWFRAHPLPGDIVFVCKGTPGAVALVPNPVDFCIAQDMVTVRADPAKVYPNYLFAALRSGAVQDQISAMHVGTLIPHFKKGEFQRLMIPLPPEKQQRVIGDTYVALSLKIESNRRMSSLILDLVREHRNLMVSASTTSPETLDSLVVINRATASPGSLEDIINYIDIASVSPARVNEVRLLSWGEAPSRARRIVEDGDVIFSTVRPNRRSFALLLDPPDETIVSTGFATLTPSRIGSAFLMAIVADPAFADYLDSVSHGSAYPAVSPEAMGRYLVATPDAERLARFEETLMPALRKGASSRREEETLISLRDALLTELMNGRLRVDDVRATVEAVV